MYPDLFHFGPFTLHTYGFMVAVGFLLGYWLSRKNLMAQGFTSDQSEKLLLGSMICGIAGARLTYLALAAPSDVLSDPLMIFRIWEGGLVFYGGFLAGAVFFIWYSQHKSHSWLKTLDGVAAPFALAHAWGRLGCFFAGCCYGRATELPVGVVFTNPLSLSPLNQRIHPTQLYEAGGNLLLFIFLMAVYKKKPRSGIVSALYLMAYSTMRFFIELLRGDFRGPVSGGLQPSQWISILVFLGGIGLFIYGQRERKSY